MYAICFLTTILTCYGDSEVASFLMKEARACSRPRLVNSFLSFRRSFCRLQTRVCGGGFPSVLGIFQPRQVSTYTHRQKSDSPPVPLKYGCGLCFVSTWPIRERHRVWRPWLRNGVILRHRRDPAAGSTSDGFKYKPRCKADTRSQQSCTNSTGGNTCCT